jgi:hypothetical protein
MDFPHREAHVESNMLYVFFCLYGHKLSMPLAMFYPCTDHKAYQRAKALGVQPEGLATSGIARPHADHQKIQRAHQQTKRHISFPFVEKCET